MPKKEKFISLHTHSDMSTLDGAGKIDDFVKEAAKRRAKAIAFTDHGTMRGFYQLHLSAKEHGVKPIYGIEFYVAKNMKRKGLTEEEKFHLSQGLSKKDGKNVIKEQEERLQLRKRWHLCAWAKNNTGLKNLFKLASLSNTEGFYYKPRIDLETLIENGDGLMIGTGCLSGIIYNMVVNGKRHAALDVADRMKERWGEDLFLEIQPHDIPEQRIANKFALELNKRWKNKVRLLATQDAHYIHKSDAKSHEVLLCIGTNNYLSDPNRFKFDGSEYYYKTRKEMFKAFRRNHKYIDKKTISEALNNTLVVADRVEAKVDADRKEPYLPEIKLDSKYDDDWDCIKDLCMKGWEWRSIAEKGVLQTYKERLRLELTLIKKKDFVKYFLVVWDICNFARREEIMMGPGRGSSAGSLVSYLLGITSVDPIEHGLLFERFIDISRSDLPDIDLDFADDRRGEIIEYLRNKYGEKKVTQIATIGKLSGKQCLKDVSRVMQVPFAVANEITGSVIERAKGDERVYKTLEDSFKDLELFKVFDERYPGVKEHSVKLEGLAKTLGVHAAGVIITPKPVYNYVPLELRKSDGESVKVTALDKDGCAALGLVKLDILGLKTLTVIQDCIKAIEKRHGKKINPETDISLDDPEVLSLFTERDFPGIFQFDSPSAIKVCEDIVFNAFKHVCALSAFNRPGTMRSGLTERWRNRMKNPELAKEVLYHPKVAKITSDTLGVICYQENVIQIFKEIGGFSPEEANKFRKEMAKSKGAETVEKRRKKFVEGAIKSGLSEKQANSLMTAIAQFGAYAFNKSHSVSYTIISVWTAYFKKHYPLEFFWANMKSEKKIEKIQRFAKDAITHGIKLLPPEVSVSGENFVIDYENNAIRGSLLDIKGVGEKAVETIVQNQPYKNFVDFATRVERRKCNMGVMVALAKAGALDELLPNVKWFVDNVSEYWKVATKKGFDSFESKRMLVDSYEKEDFDTEEKQLLSISVNPTALGGRPIDAYKDFIKREIKVPISLPGKKSFYKRNNSKGVFIVGTIANTKVRRIGDFNVGKTYTELEKMKMNWGAQYINVNLDCSDGSQIRVKFDYDVYSGVQSVLSSGVNTPLVVHAVPNADYNSIRGDYAIHLEQFRLKRKKEEELSFWEKIIIGEHPVLNYPWKNETIRKKWSSNSEFSSGSRGGKFCGIVTHIRVKADKTGADMAFFGLQGVNEHVECVCFGSVWPSIKKSLKVKELVIMDLKKDSGNFIYDGGFAKIFKKKTSF